MADVLYLRLGSHAPDEVTWTRVTSGGTARELRRGLLSAAAAEARECGVVAFVPARDVITTEVQVPTRNARRIAQAVPYLLEDHLVGNVEAQHFALGERAEGGTVPVAVIARERMQHWLDMLDEAGLQADALVPETLSLPYADGTWTLACNASSCMLRTGAAQGLGLDADNLPFILQRELAAADPAPQRIEVYACSGEAMPDLPDSAGLAITNRNCGGDLLVPLVSGYRETEGINLLQGRYIGHSGRAGTVRSWLPAAVLLAVWILVEVAAGITHYVGLKGREHASAQQIEEIYFRAFPAATSMVRPKVRMERLLAGLTGGGQSQEGLLTLLAAAGKAITDTAGAKLTMISYRDGRMDIEVELDDLKILEHIKRALATDKSLAVEIKSASSRNQRVDGRISIRSRKP